MLTNNKILLGGIVWCIFVTSSYASCDGLLREYAHAHNSGNMTVALHVKRTIVDDCVKVSAYTPMDKKIIKVKGKKYVIGVKHKAKVKPKHTYNLKSKRRRRR
jgi:hypothetical protein